MSEFTNRTWKQNLPAYRYIRTTDKMPKIGETEGQDPLVRVKLFDPSGSWTWYLIEFDGEDEAYGLVSGHELELGYISMNELSQSRSAIFKLPIERDIHFKPVPLSQLQAKLEARRA